MKRFPTISDRRADGDPVRTAIVHRRPVLIGASGEQVILPPLDGTAERWLTATLHT